jgi:hypothetical protein
VQPHNSNQQTVSIETGAATSLLLKRAATSRPSGEWSEDDYEVMAGGDVVGRIYKADATAAGTPWKWPLAF